MIPSRVASNFVTAEPFRPFRITLTSGRVFDIPHPEMIEVSRTYMTVHTSMSDDPEVSKDHFQRVSLLLVETVEPLDTTAPARPQGAA